MPLDAASRGALLGEMIGQLQSDRERAIAAGNIAAAITADKSIADLLQVRLAPTEQVDKPVTVQIVRFTPDHRRLVEELTALLTKLAEARGTSVNSSEIHSEACEIADRCSNVVECEDQPAPVRQAAPEQSAEDRALAERLLAMFPGNELDRILDSAHDH